MGHQHPKLSTVTTDTHDRSASGFWVGLTLDRMLPSASATVTNMLGFRAIIYSRQDRAAPQLLA
jgi:hypothetical protein